MLIIIMIIIIKVNYNYCKKSPRVLIGIFLKKALYVEDNKKTFAIKYLLMSPGLG